MDKKGQEELEQWEAKRREEEKNKYGFNFSDLNNKNFKKIDTTAKVLSKIGNTIFIIVTIVFAIAILALAGYAIIKYMNIKSRLDVDVKGTLETIYSIKIKLKLVSVDDNHREKYIAEVKNSNMEFHVIKRFGTLQEDYPARLHKIYFEKWNDENKNKFTVVEEENDFLLNYETYIEVENVDEAVDAVELITDFMNFCNYRFFAMWSIYIKYNGDRIYPYHTTGMTKTEAINNVKTYFEN